VGKPPKSCGLTRSVPSVSVSSDTFFPFLTRAPSMFAAHNIRAVVVKRGVISQGTCPSRSVVQTRTWYASPADHFPRSQTITPHVRRGVVLDGIHPHLRRRRRGDGSSARRWVGRRSRPITEFSSACARRWTSRKAIMASVHQLRVIALVSAPAELRCVVSSHVR